MGISFQFKGSLSSHMYRKCELGLEGIKSAKPIHPIPRAYVGPAAKRLQPAAVFILYEQITTES
jgi:hypothetical protein